MVRTIVFALGASLPLLAGGALGAFWTPPRPLTAVALAFAAGALISATSFELFEEGFESGGATSVGLSFAAGALVFVAVDSLLERRMRRGATGFALLAAVTLDGIPENTALGVSLVGGGSVALLVAVFASNFPEGLVGAANMREQGRSPRSIILLWGGATALLAVAVVLGRSVFVDSPRSDLAVPLGFAAGAVLASVIDTLAPEAFRDGGPWIALGSAAGFFASYMLSV